MFNFFYQNSPVERWLSVVLMTTMLSLAGGWILFYPQITQAADVVIDPTNLAAKIGDWVWKIGKAAWEKVAEAYHAAGTWITTNLGLSERAWDMIKEAGRIAAVIVMHQVLNMMTNQIVKWIQGGGTPRFVSDWGGFLSDAFDKAGGLFVEKYLGMGYLCEPFDMSVKIALLPVPTFEERVKCSISDIVDNINDFADDFSKGGWKGWIKLTEPQNNFYGAYFAAREEKLETAVKAREAALNEAASASGFLPVKACIKGHTEDEEGEISANCNDKDSCSDLEDDLYSDETFVCDQEKVVTPGSALSDLTNEILEKDFKLLQRQIADMTDSLGNFAPYVITIANALINRVIQEGFAYVTATGPTKENPNTPMPPGASIPSVDQTPSQVTQDQGSASSLLEQQELLKENLVTQLLPQQQSNLSVLQSIRSTQNSTLTTLENVLEDGCSMPAWADSQVISTTSSGNTTIQTIRISSPEIGSSLVEKITTTDDDGDTDTIYQTKETTPSVDSQITSLQEDIVETNEWIADTTTAINSTNGYNQTAEEYLDLYKATLQPPTTQEQIALDQKKQLMSAAKDIAISNGQLVARTSTSTNSFFDVNTDTQNTSINAVQTATNLLLARGVSTSYPQPGTLYAQKSSVQGVLANTQSYLSTCDDDDDDD